MIAFVASALLWGSAIGCGRMAVNVPLNEALAAADPATAQGAALWARYAHDWTRWNHVRTVASVAACVLFVAGIAAR
ncbi:DUF1772 domain-containing protein [Burkholderia sp. Bp9142]|nr:DUF1772 domain-containing protein [Burkholderia sp. Bp9142]